MVASGTPNDAEPPLLGDTPEVFGRLVDPYRRELLVHCYRMLGSLDDAEDAVQDAMINAWRRRGTYVQDRSLRAWLYRIASNACLDAIDRRSRHLGDDVHVGVTPIPDALLLVDAAASPEARIDARESVSLAFLTALQVLPPRQRAVLILRDVLSWRSVEVARLLGVSVPAVNSALQRARGTVSRRSQRVDRVGDQRQDPVPGQSRGLLERYVHAWETADITGLVALLREDALLSMPPRPAVEGAGPIGDFLRSSMLLDGRRTRLVPAAANRRVAFMWYRQGRPDAPFEAFALLVLEEDGRSFSRLDAFVDPRVLTRFGPARLSG